MSAMAWYIVIKKTVQNEALGTFILQTSEINGNNWNTFSLENDGWGGGRVFVYPPMIEQQIDVYRDDEFEAENAKDIFNDYCAQLEG